MKKNKILRKIIDVLITLAILGLLVYIVWSIGFDTITDRAKLTNYIKRYGAWAPLVFFCIQFLQVLAAPIPGNVTGLVGGALFGVWVGFLINSLATLLGSMLMFAVGRRFGMRFVKRFVDEEIFEKYEARLSGKGAKNVLLGIFLVPFLPDDIICLIAGITNISYKSFFFIAAVGRVPSCFITNAVGAGLYSDNMLIIVVMAVVYYAVVFVIYHYAERIKRFFLRNTADKGE